MRDYSTLHLNINSSKGNKTNTFIAVLHFSQDFDFGKQDIFLSE